MLRPTFVLVSGKGMVVSPHQWREKHLEARPGILMLKNGVDLNWVQGKKD